MRLSKVMREYLWVTKTSQRAFGEQIGWGSHTVNRFVTGQAVDGAHLAILLRWLLEAESTDREQTSTDANGEATPPG